MKSRLVTKLGAFSYGAAVIFNKGINALLRPLTGREIRFSKAIKHWVKRKVRSVEDFQQKAIDVALEKEADCLVCGHNHLPEIRNVNEGTRSEARRVGKECVSTCRCRGSTYHQKKNYHSYKRRTGTSSK